MQNESDRAVLVREAVVGNADAMQRLIVQYHNQLRGVVDNQLPGDLRRFVDPDDVLQQAYVAAFQSIKKCTFDGPGGFYKWLERIAIDCLRKTNRDLRRKKRDIGRVVTDSRSLESSMVGLVDRLAASEPTPSRHLARKEASAALLTSLARLSEDQRAVVRMRFLEDHPISEIAESLGKSETAIYSLCGRAIRKLEKLLVSITRFLSSV